MNEVQISYGPEPELPDWRQGEIDEDGNRLWMVNVNGRFIKYVEYMPEWIKDVSVEQFYGGLAKVHPTLLDINGVMTRCGGFDFVISRFICPQDPPEPALNAPQPNQLYCQQITTSREIHRLRNGAR